jgi:hypothetical protein
MSFMAAAQLTASGLIDSISMGLVSGFGFLVRSSDRVPLQMLLIQRHFYKSHQSMSLISPFVSSSGRLLIGRCKERDKGDDPLADNNIKSDFAKDNSCRLQKGLFGVFAFESLMLIS